MTERPRRLRRTQLSVPASNEKMLIKAASSAADHVFLDLEDSVAPNAKATARVQAVQALKGLDWGHKTRCVRINDLETPYAYEDVITMVEGAHEHLDTIMIPKAKGARDVLWVDTLLRQLELKLGAKERIGLEVLIEEAEGMINVEQIAASTSRLECLIFGLGDYSASHGIPIRYLNGMAPGGYPGDIWHYARFRVVMACRANGLDAVDGPFPNFHNIEGFREECRRALALGCTGKWAIHPVQIGPALEVFSPDPMEVAHARKLARAYEDAQRRGDGAVQVDGVMVDLASIRILQNTLRKAELLGI